MKKILVIAPHPDDETLGCGGSLLRHKASNDQINWMIFTSVSGAGSYSYKYIEKRVTEINKVAEFYGFKHTHQLNFPAMELDTVPYSKMISAASKIILELKPEVIYIPFPGDVHSDHRIVFDVIAPLTKSFRYPYVKSVRIYETISETEFSINPTVTNFKPNMWIDISDYIDKKLDAMSLYSSEVCDFPFPRSIEAIRSLAMLRGSTISVQAAEAFMSIKEVL